jgi:hypothetical protein
VPATEGTIQASEHREEDRATTKEFCKGDRALAIGRGEGEVWRTVAAIERSTGEISHSVPFTPRSEIADNGAYHSASAPAHDLGP